MFSFSYHRGEGFKRSGEEQVAGQWEKFRKPWGVLYLSKVKSVQQDYYTHFVDHPTAVNTVSSLGMKNPLKERNIFLRKVVSDLIETSRMTMANGYPGSNSAGAPVPLTTLTTKL